MDARGSESPVHDRSPKTVHSTCVHSSNGPSRPSTFSPPHPRQLFSPTQPTDCFAIVHPGRAVSQTTLTRGHFADFAATVFGYTREHASQMPLDPSCIGRPDVSCTARQPSPGREG